MNMAMLNEILAKMDAKDASRLSYDLHTALYCRTAVMDRFALKNQKERVSAYAEAKRYKVSFEYIDSGISGSSLERLGIKKLMDDIESGIVKTVIIASPSRIARGFAPFIEWLQFWKRQMRAA